MQASAQLEMAYHFEKIMKSWSTKSSEVARMILFKQIFICLLYIQDLANNIQRIREEVIIYFFYFFVYLVCPAVCP